jgi:hypothetical protein
LCAASLSFLLRRKEAALLYCFDSVSGQFDSSRFYGFVRTCLHLRLQQKLAAIVQLCQSQVLVKPRAHSRVSK